MFFPGDPLNYPPNSISSIRRYESNRAPNNFDLKNFDLGDEWLDTSTNDWYKLSSKANGSAAWCNLCASISGDPIDFLQTDDGPPPVAPDGDGIVNLLGGNGITTSGQDPLTTVTIDLDSPVSIANGGTNATSFIQGSVIFMGAAAFSEDNPNLFWDDTNNRLGIGTNTPLHEIHVIGSADIVHIADESDDYAIKIDCDCSGFTDVKALDIVYTSGAVSDGEKGEAMLVNIDESASVGGIISGYEILTTEEGIANIVGMLTGINVFPIIQNSGTFVDADDILNIAVDVTAALASGGAGNISIFVADNDTMTIGDAAQFGEMEIIVDTIASEDGVAPIFEFSTGGIGFSDFSPSDGTNGFRNTGAILWDANDLAGWIANATGLFEIRITRTRNILSTTPIIDKLQISATTEFIWDKKGDVNINSLMLVVPLEVTEGGTGRDSHTAFAVICGGITSTDPQQSIASVGTIDQLLTSNGPGALPTFQDSNSLPFRWNEVTGTSQAAEVNNGYITNNASLVTVTLPSTAIIGDIVEVVGKGAGFFRISQNSGQSIFFSNVFTTTGTGGFISSEIDDQYSAVKLLCTTIDTGWTVISSIGNLRITPA